MADSEKMQPIQADAILAKHLGEAADGFYGVTVHNLRKAASSGAARTNNPDGKLVNRRGKVLHEKLVQGNAPSYETEEELAGLAGYVRKMMAKYSSRPGVDALLAMMARRIESAHHHSSFSAAEEGIIQKAFTSLPLADVPLFAFRKVLLRLMGNAAGR